jgi:hypothetical protein
MLEEKRAYRRLPVAISVRIGMAQATTTNLSLTGAQIAWPVMSYQLAQRRLDHERLELTLALPGTPFDVLARIVYISDVEDEVLLGVEFIEPDEASRDPLRAYLRQVATRSR